MPDSKDIKKKEISHKLIKRNEKPNYEKVFEPTKGDVVHTLTKAGISTIPGIGGMLGEIFSFGVESPLEKRKRALLTHLGKRLDELEKKALIKSEELKNNDEFLDIITHAMQIVIRSSQKEKIEALRNAILNTALKINIDSDTKFSFLRCIDDLRPTHLQILKFFRSPKVWFENHDVDISKTIFPTPYHALCEAFPIFVHDNGVQYVQELMNMGFLNSESNWLQERADPSSIFYSRITERGKLFMEFIKVPKHLVEE